jgi:hypothetical protein
MQRRTGLARLAYREYKVTRQVSTGNGESFLAAGARPPAGFVMGELGFGVHERPCTDCHKPCTLDYTLNNLREINRANLRELNKRDPLSVPDRISSVDGDVREQFKLPLPADSVGAREHSHSHRHKHGKLSAADARRHLRAQARRAGIRVVRGEYVDERERTWLPDDPNRLGRGGVLRRKITDADGKVIAVKRIDLRAKKLIKQHRASAAPAPAAAG